MLLRRLVLAYLCLMTYGLAWAQRTTVWVVAADATPVYREVADALRAEIERTQPGSVEWVMVNPQQVELSAPAPRLIVTIGSGALAAVVAKTRPGESFSPILATLLPRAAFDRELARAPRKLNASAILLDQPPARQVTLIRTALPAAKRIGLLLGPESQASATAFRSAMTEQGLLPNVEDVTQRGWFAALQSLLDDSDALLAIADPAVFNSETLGNILTAGYRRKVPLIAFSPAYVRAGALLGLYATPAQVGRAGAESVRAVLAGAALPPPAAPREFAIDVNAAVARSLGFALNEDELRQRMRAGERQP